MDSAAWDPAEDPVVGFVTDEETGSTPGLQAGDALESVVDAHDGTLVTGDLETEDVRAADVLVARGDRTLSVLARAGIDSPVVPVAPATGVEAVDPDQVSNAVAAVLEGDATVRERAVLELEGVDAGTQRALLDVALVTDEPARISEYGVHSLDGEVATFRADGVVVATPAGSHGYASAVDASLLSSAVDAVAVAPIAPFVTNTRRWVLPQKVTLTVERDEGDVTVLADGQAVETVSLGADVTVTAAREGLETLVVADELLETPDED
ncbi:NAD(+)/NADH kinase [Natronobacterium texcoconense]|uniref:NAD+ kinase n=1 Tax=Natronobacterium texcoconense TaxID=1095778 RepID=A0A1H1A3P4_NATTX|nr:NAD(+)/NADH kinase [Natronobacterium texcoconense]SDQ34325.1 NAD+ kinase [Natronobacterium texcoconense]